MQLVDRLRAEILFIARARLFDASNDVEWIDSTMYDQEAVVDLYDTASLLAGKPFSPFRSPSDLEFLDMVRALGISSVLDLGCGAGAFYHALSSIKPDIRYYGYDLSATQIGRAKLRFGDHFALRDIATITTEEFSRYDAVHVNSVFSFMSVADQIETIRRVVHSRTLLLTETGVTNRDIRFAPRSAFKNFSKTEVQGQALLTVVSFPFQQEIEAVVTGTKHALHFTEQPYPRSALTNNSTRSGGALVDKSGLKRHHPFFDRLHPPGNFDTLVRARIAPKCWRHQKSRDYSLLSADDVRQEILQLLRPI